MQNVVEREKSLTKKGITSFTPGRKTKQYNIYNSQKNWKLSSDKQQQQKIELILVHTAYRQITKKRNITTEGVQVDVQNRIEQQQQHKRETTQQKSEKLKQKGSSKIKARNTRKQYTAL